LRENAIGRAKFKRDADIGHLKVSFFGPFFGNYIIFELDKENYQYAFVTGGKNLRAKKSVFRNRKREWL